MEKSRKMIRNGYNHTNICYFIDYYIRIRHFLLIYEEVVEMQTSQNGERVNCRLVSVDIERESSLKSWCMHALRKQNKNSKSESSLLHTTDDRQPFAFVWSPLMQAGSSLCILLVFISASLPLGVFKKASTWGSWCIFGLLVRGVQHVA